MAWLRRMFVLELGFVNSQTISQRESTQPKMNPITEDDFFPDVTNDEIKTTRSSKSSDTSVGSLSSRRVSSELPRINKLNSALISTRRKSRTMSVINNVGELDRTRSYSLPSTSGLSELDFEYNALHPGRPANVSLVSRGAECIMISKKFFMEHANALTKRWIRLNVQPYLPTERHQQTLQEKIDWDAFKRKLVTSVVRENSKTNLI